MPVPEGQLETWSHQGSIAQSASTYQIVRNVLNDGSAPFSNRSFDVFLQGSYGNDTNVYKDSDVDILIRLNGLFYYDLSALTESARATFHAAHPGKASYTYREFHTDVLSWLQQRFGLLSTTAGGKAIYVKGDGSRRDADIVPCAKFRRYRAASNGADLVYDEGICLFPRGGSRIDDFPRQHRDNCTAKHQATSFRFKPAVRIVKNMRNRMIELDLVKDGLAPSYFLEGMLWNVPNGLFVASHFDTIVGALNWVIQSDKSKLVCANGLQWLARDNSPASWRVADLEAFLAAVTKYWNDWGK